MQKILILLYSSIFLVVETSCNKRVSEEQLSAAREELRDREIRRISPAEIYLEALEVGNSTEKKTDVDGSLILLRIETLDISQETDDQVISDIINAYSYEQEQGNDPDPQVLDRDSVLIYSRLIKSDSTVLLVVMSKKELIREMD